MRFISRVRQVEEFRTDASLVKDKELELAMALIDSLTATFEPEKYKDTYRENLKALIDAKVQGKETVAAPAPQHLAPVVDILEALKLSLAEGKKPPRSVLASTAASEAAPQPQTAPKKGKKTVTG